MYLNLALNQVLQKFLPRVHLCRRRGSLRPQPQHAGKSNRAPHPPYLKTRLVATTQPNPVVRNHRPTSCGYQVSPGQSIHKHKAPVIGKLETFVGRLSGLNTLCDQVGVHSHSQDQLRARYRMELTRRAPWDTHMGILVFLCHLSENMHQRLL